MLAILNKTLIAYDIIGVTTNKFNMNTKSLMEYKTRTLKIPNGIDKFDAVRINPIAGKLLFGKLTNEESDFLKKILADEKKTEIAVMNLFMFSDLRHVAEIYIASEIELDISIGRGDFDFIKYLIGGFDCRNVQAVEEFFEACWYGGQVTDEFIRPFSHVFERITALKVKYLKQFELQKRMQVSFFDKSFTKRRISDNLKW